jgi:hypothetical protein
MRKDDYLNHCEYEVYNFPDVKNRCMRWAADEYVALRQAHPEYGFNQILRVLSSWARNLGISTPDPLFCGGCNSFSLSQEQLPHTQDTVSELFHKCLPYGPSSYKTLLQALQKSHSYVNIWGTHRIKLAGHDGSETYSGVKCLLRTIILQNKEFNEDERALGKQCQTELRRLYIEKDDSLLSKSLFTKLILKIIGIFSCYKPLPGVMSSTDLLKSYTPSQFLRAFESTPQDYFGEYCYLYQENDHSVTNMYWASASEKGEREKRIASMPEDYKSYIRRMSERVR